MVKEAFQSVIHIFRCKSGGLFYFSCFLGIILTALLASCSASVQSHEHRLYYILYDDSKAQDVIIPVIIQAFGMMIYIMFNLIDLLTGLQAAKYENSKKEVPEKNYIKSSKLYKTLWKVLGVMFITSLFMTLTLIFEALKPESFYYWVGILAMVVFWIMSIGMEFHSIGENIERRSGSKPAIFGFWDKILSAFEKKAIKKIDEL